MEIPIDVPIEHIRSFVVLCSHLGESSELIKNKLTILFGDKAPKKTFIYTWMNAINDGRNSFNDEPRSGRPVKHTELREIVQKIIEEEPFQSTRSISSQLGVNRESIRYILKEELNLRKFTCKYVPHILTPERRENRINCAMKMLETMKNDRAFKNIVTGDEAWFFLDNPVDGQWASSIDEVKKNVNRTIQSKKVMLTILWGIEGFYVVEALANKQKFDSDYFTSLLVKLKKNLHSMRRSKSMKKVYLHLDNAKVHTSRATVAKAEELGFKIMEHPSYSPDIAPSDFFLFGYIKEKLKNKNFETVDELMQEIYQILNDVDRETRLNVLQNWLHRLETVIETEGAYIEE